MYIFIGTKYFQARWKKYIFLSFLSLTLPILTISLCLLTVHLSFLFSLSLSSYTHYLSAFSLSIFLSPDYFFLSLPILAFSLCLLRPPLSLSWLFLFLSLYLLFLFAFSLSISFSLPFQSLLLTIFLSLPSPPIFSLFLLYFSPSHFFPYSLSVSLFLSWSLSLSLVIIMSLRITTQHKILLHKYMYITTLFSTMIVFYGKYSMCLQLCKQIFLCEFELHSHDSSLCSSPDKVWKSTSFLNKKIIPCIKWVENYFKY